MSKNYERIATVDIDIQSPIVDSTSFDNLLILGPAPKGENTAPSVGAFTSLSEVEEAGFVSSGDDADPVGAAAKVAFSQSPRPTKIYIATQQLSSGAVAAAETISEANETISSTAGAKENITGCTLEFDEDTRYINVVLTDTVANVKNTGLIDTLTNLVAQEYTVSLDGEEVATVAEVKKTAAFKAIAAMTKGCADVLIVATVAKDGANEVKYGIAVSFPDPDATEATASTAATEPLDSPEQELEDPTATIARALQTDGWYVLCTAGVDSGYYEDIAAYIETQEKMFYYTELDYFGAGEDGENEPSVGKVYYRSMGIYGRETTSEADDDIPDANKYANVAHAAKWLYYDSGSETAAFKTLSSVYPSTLSTTEMDALDADNINYFVTVGSKNITLGGKTMAGEWADIIRFRDWLKNDMLLRVVNLFVVNPKIPYTDNGIALVQNQMLASLKAGTDRGGIAQDEFDEDGNRIPGYETSVPLASSLTASEKASRKLHNCKFKARLAGAIHFAELTGSLTYEL